ncbi:hypothetical protein [Methylicorpusculum sp.]|uniref:hypothetical protein n=1 Tax=Methylicorpusculum sp. TaxID=2713644 RepID=UPI002762AAAA|nr:hypothetical protein [Methylicorpusculum sp.]MDP3530759.1 hypothetical protein [Methylicorpusculum sp.]MDZ4154251.1 hypothetical protein [Methylicorpusculum sp.]
MLPFFADIENAWYTYRRSKFGTGVPVKGRRKYIHVGSMPASHAGKAFAEHTVASLGTAEI